MTFQSWFVYLLLVLVACSTPGSAVLFVVTNTTLFGWKKAIFSALGNITGLLLLGIAAVTGLGALISASELFFNLVKYLGAAYLVYLGVKMLCGGGLDAFTELAEIPAEKSGRRVFFQAIGIALSNPKAIVFLTALFPQFLDIERPLASQFAILILTLMFFSFVFLLGYGFLALKARNWISNPRRIKVFNRLSGSVFIGFGALLSTTHS